jgi:hypothetical protein
MKHKLSGLIPTGHHRGLLWWLLVLAVGVGPFAAIQSVAERGPAAPVATALAGEVARWTR